MTFLEGLRKCLGSAREPRKRRIRKGNRSDTTFEILTPRRADSGYGFHGGIKPS
jgi:hypothetical protein